MANARSTGSRQFSENKLRIVFSDGDIVNFIYDRGIVRSEKDITKTPDQAYFDKVGKVLRATDPNWENYTANIKRYRNRLNQ